MKQRLKSVGRTVCLVLASAVVTTAIITACGGSSGGGGIIERARSLIFNSNPLGFHATSGFGPGRQADSSSAFTVNAQSPTPGGGNFPGFCSSTPAVSGRAAVVPFGLGSWSSGDCAGSIVSDSNVGVAIPANGQIGQLTVDAIGQGTGADDGKIGLASIGSGQIELKVIHADGTQATTPITCTFGISNPGAKVHCEDKNAAHNSDVTAGDQIVARYWFNPGDSYNSLRVNVQYATPTF